MSEELKAGDRVTYTGEFIVTRDTTPFEVTASVRHPSGGGSMVVWKPDVQKVVPPKPPLPTAFGSVVEVDGVKWVLDKNWFRDGRYGTMDAILQPRYMAERDYTVLRDGI